MARTGLGEVIFAAIEAGTTLKPHCAQNNLRLTCQLGLLCPEGARIRVGSQWDLWQEGRCIIFDDSYEHEVVHEGAVGGVRVVLLLRLWHPGVPDSRRSLVPDLDEAFQISL